MGLDIRKAIEDDVTHVLEEAERPMSAEEILPHLHPIMPSANDIADALASLSARGDVEREGSYYRRHAVVPIDTLFAPPLREQATQIVELIRALDRKSGHGARLGVVLKAAEGRGVPSDRTLDIIARLRIEGEAYSVGGDRLRLAKS